MENVKNYNIQDRIEVSVYEVVENAMLQYHLQQCDVLLVDIKSDTRRLGNGVWKCFVYIVSGDTKFLWYKKR